MPLPVANSKGGVGKTTTSLNLAGELAKRGYQVLPLYPQGNAIAAFTQAELPATTDRVLVTGGGLLEAAVPTALVTLSLLGAGPELRAYCQAAARAARRLPQRAAQGADGRSRRFRLRHPRLPLLAPRSIPRPCWGCARRSWGSRYNGARNYGKGLVISPRSPEVTH